MADKTIKPDLPTIDKMAKEQRLNRLKNEYENLTREIDRLPFIEVVSIEGDPPYRYNIAYTLKSLTLHPTTKKLSFSEYHEVEITLYRDYPDVPPYCQIKTDIFHPNIPKSRKYLAHEKSWSPEQSLLSVVKRIGALISYQEYDLTLPRNKEAAKWVNQNKSSLPLDTADLSTEETSKPSSDQQPGSKDLCTYCHEPNSGNKCSNGHLMCDQCISNCKHCDNATCLACYDNACRACAEKIEAFRVQMTEKIKEGNLDDAVAVGKTALEAFDNPRQLQKTFQNLKKIKEIIGETGELEKLKCFVALVVACDELRSLGFSNETTAKLETESANMLYEADDLVAKGKDVLYVDCAPKRAFKHFADALKIVSDHPSASKLARAARRQVGEAKKQIEFSKESLAKGEFEHAMRAANKAVTLDVSLKSQAGKIIERARKFQTIVPGRKKERVVGMATTITALVLIVITGVLFWQYDRMKDKYRKVLEQVEEEQTLEGKMQKMQAYVNSFGANIFFSDAEDRMWNLERLIQKRDYEVAVREANMFIDQKAYEEAEAIYEDYLGRYPKNMHTEDLHKRLIKVLGLIEQRDDESDYRNLRALSEHGLRERVEAYNYYLASYPKGKYRDEVKEFLVDSWQEFSSVIREQMESGQERKDWNECILLCDALDKQLNGPTWEPKIESLRSGCRKRDEDERALDTLNMEASAKGKNYGKAKQLYVSYLETNPDSSVHRRIENRIDMLDKKIQDRRDWEEVLTYIGSEENGLHARIDRLKEYKARNPSDEYVEKAGQKLQGLEETHDNILWVETIEQSENPTLDITVRISALESFLRENMSGKYIGNAKAQLDTLKAEHERILWQEVVRYCEKPTIPLPKRIRKLKDFVSKRGSGQFAEDAKAAMERLRALQAEEQRIRRRIAASGGMYVYNNGMITDRRTGLTWCAFDSYLELGQCLTYGSAMQYLEKLRYGGHSDWRMPSEDALKLIYKNRPFFPTAAEGRWYWTSNQLGERVVPVVTTKREIGWGGAEIESFVGCGSVRAVRGP